MADNIVTNYTYAITETANNQVNTGILKEELDELTGLTVSVGNVSVAGSNILIEMLGDAVAADETLVDAAVAAHEGDAFVETPLEEVDNTMTTEETGTETSILSLETGPLEVGEYLVGFSMSFGSSTASPEVETEVFFKTKKNSDAPISRNEDSSTTNQFRNFAGTYLLKIRNGQQYTLSLWMTGNTTNFGRARRRRLYIVKAA